MSPADTTQTSDRLVINALVVSLLLHLLIFGTWKMGQARGWWLHTHLPAWMQASQKLLLPIVPKKIPLPKPELRPPQLNFVDTDPALATPTPPVKPKFYSANNSVAANPHPKNLPVPEINGHQEKVIKTTPNSKLNPKPLQPSPPARPAPQVKPQTAASKPMPKQALAPGEMTMAKPADKPQENKGQASTSEPGAENQPQVQPAPDRPRTIADAMARSGMKGDTSHQEGGAKTLRMDSSLDAMKTSYGDYDRDFIDAVQTRWGQLLQDRAVDNSGKVMVEFRLHPDGRITDLKMVQNDMSDLLGLICTEAINDPAPYRRWPLEMRRDIPKDYRDITFTFFY